MGLSGFGCKEKIPPPSPKAEQNFDDTYKLLSSTFNKLTLQDHSV